MATFIKYVGIDSWNRPVFKSVDTPRHYYGDVHTLFSYEATEEEVLAKIDVEDLCYFGSKFDCEPYGTAVSDLEIIRRDK